MPEDLLQNIEEFGQDEIDDIEDRISTTATTAETVDQLALEVETLQGLERMALGVLSSGQDTKWSQLNRILDDELMMDADGNRRKLIIFTEPKDTLFYLHDRVRSRLGRADAVEVIHGGVSREDRRKIVERFMQDRDMLVLIANDAAGEGVNLQRGHLMVNYDLPWNPNKIEQRFGRIHRIGQTEVCHLWNLVAADTREGEVYGRLLEKLEAAREALGGRVYDVLGELFEGTALKDLLFEAIQYGEQPEVKARLFQAVDGAVDQQHLLDLLARRALTNETMPAAKVQEIRLDMERAEAQRLQPHHIQSFFIDAFKRLGGQIKPREEGRWEVTHVPVSIRERDRQIGTGSPVQKKYERICFEKSKVNQQPVATFVCPGHHLGKPDQIWTSSGPFLSACTSTCQSARYRLPVYVKFTFYIHGIPCKNGTVWSCSLNLRALSRVPPKLQEQLPLKCSEGLGLALADDEDGAVMVFQWCNKAFSQATGYSVDDVIGRRGTILIGHDMEQGMHLLIIDKLMNWERFSVKTITNRRSGEPYRVQMTWTPLSDPATRQRWWLCSLIELETQSFESWTSLAPGKALVDNEALGKLSEELVRLEKENRRLFDLAKTVARESKEDPLTGLSNRRHFEVQLKAWVAGLRKGGFSFAILCVDLDRFKSVNDTLGHGAGDQLLIHVADVLRRLSEDADLIARMGGDEFVILKPLGDSALKISGLADKIVLEMRKPFIFEGKSILCSASVGVALADGKTANPEQVVADADEALYHAKATGRGRWSYFTAEMHAQSIATKQLAAELLVACDRHEFIPYFQPIIDAATGHLASAEMLVRWVHPQRGLLLPGDFLHVAAAMGIVNQIDRLVFGALKSELRLLDDSGVNLPRVAINVSAGRLEDPSFIHDVKSSGIDCSRIVVEILESVYLERMSETVRWTLDELADLGVTVAVDDFGTGHASVQGLLKITPKILKIDREFIRPVVDDITSRELLAAIVGIGKSLGMKIVAEGVETNAHAQVARELGCDYLQGYFFGKPMSAFELLDRLMKTNGQLWHHSV